jgi:hypothetical protein
LSGARGWKRFVSAHDHPRLDLSPMLAFDDWDAKSPRQPGATAPPMPMR